MWPGLRDRRGLHDRRGRRDRRRCDCTRWRHSRRSCRYRRRRELPAPRLVLFLEPPVRLLLFLLQTLQARETFLASSANRSLARLDLFLLWIDLRYHRCGRRCWRCWCRYGGSWRCNRRRRSKRCASSERGPDRRYLPGRRWRRSTRLHRRRGRLRRSRRNDRLRGRRHRRTRHRRRRRRRPVLQRLLALQPLATQPLALLRLSLSRLGLLLCLLPLLRETVLDGGVDLWRRVRDGGDSERGHALLDAALHLGCAFLGCELLAPSRGS